MKNIKNYIPILFAMTLLAVSCKKFDAINVNPVAANESQVLPEYFINQSIIDAQQNPDVAERSFVLYWKTAAHYQEDEGLSSGAYNDGWTSAYYNKTASWQNSINTAIRIGQGYIDAGTPKEYTNNLIQVARIWKAYLMSEMSDVFGPIAIKASEGVNPDFNNVKDVYYFMLDELKDATTKMDLTVAPANDALKKLDPAYGYDYAKWQKFGNSLRLRLAMRLSEVDPAKAKSEFEAAASTNKFITTMSETFQVQEKPGWDDLSGVMSREWNPQFLSQTMYNLFVGLGGVKSATQLDATFAPYIKPAGYVGLKLENHFPTKTNNPITGYWMDGLPNTIDPRAYKSFIIPGDFANPNFNTYPSWTDGAKTTKRDLVDEKGDVVKTIDAKYTYNPSVNGNWGEKGDMNKVANYFEGTVPRLSNAFRTSEAKRIFFAPWDTYFLLAEASERGWSTPVTGKTAYEAGIAASFAYWNVPVGSYLGSTDYNLVGTSVSWDHVAEPPASHTMDYVNGYTGTAGTATILYPKNDLYKNGSVKNDHLTKIITQKFIANNPWSPIEAWNDQRRLGLPFFENPAVEQPITDLPALNSGNFMTSNVKFFPQRIKYPSGLQNTNPEGYTDAVSALNGEDAILTPLWWAKH